MSEHSWGKQKDGEKVNESCNSSFFDLISGNSSAVNADSTGKGRCTNEGFKKGGVEDRSLHRYRASNLEPRFEDIMEDGDDKENDKDKDDRY